MTTLFVIAFFMVAFYLWRHWDQKQILDAEAYYWSTCFEPLVFISRTPFDTTVSEAANEARAKLKEHGNQFLTDADVWEYPYRATIIDGVPNEQINSDFGQFLDVVFQHAIMRRAKWRSVKISYTQDAVNMFSNQTKTAPSAN